MVPPPCLTIGVDGAGQARKPARLLASDSAWQTFAQLRSRHAPLAYQLTYWTNAAPSAWTGGRAELPITPSPDIVSGVLRVSTKTFPILPKAPAPHDEHMESFAEQVISTYISPLVTPGLLLAAAVSVVVLVTGLGAKLIEVGQTTVQALADRDVVTGPSPHLGFHDTDNGERQ